MAASNVVLTAGGGVARCLAKDPGARFRDVAELARALAPLSSEASRSVERISRVLGHAAVIEPASIAGAGAGATGATSTSAAARSDTAWGATRAAGMPRRSPAVWIAVGGLGVGAAAIAVAAVAMRGTQGGEAAQAAATASAMAAPSALPSAELAPPAETVLGAGADASGGAGARAGVSGDTGAGANLGAGKPHGHAGKATSATAQPAVAGDAPASPPTRPAPPPAPAPTPTNALDMPFK